MHDQLHAAGFVEKPLEDDRVVGRQYAERGVAGGEVFGKLPRRGLADAGPGREPLD